MLTFAEPTTERGRAIEAVQLALLVQWRLAKKESRYADEKDAWTAILAVGRIGGREKERAEIK